MFKAYNRCTNAPFSTVLITTYIRSAFLSMTGVPTMPILPLNLRSTTVLSDLGVVRGLPAIVEVCVPILEPAICIERVDAVVHSGDVKELWVPPQIGTNGA